MPKSAGKKQIYLPKTDRLYITIAEARKITDQQVREHIASPKPECACEECQEMCRIRPCWGTPKKTLKTIWEKIQNEDNPNRILGFIKVMT